MAYDLKDYVEVHVRVEKFYDRYPEGSIQSFVTHRPTSEWPFIEVQSFAYRTPEDPRPGIGNSAESFPGKTSFTKDSELENAETSAVGRALAALGFETKRSMASANELRTRRPPAGDQSTSATPDRAAPTGEPSPAGEAGAGGVKGKGAAASASSAGATKDSAGGARARLAMEAQRLGWDDDRRHAEAGVSSFTELSEDQAKFLIAKWRKIPTPSGQGALA